MILSNAGKPYSNGNFRFNTGSNTRMRLLRHTDDLSNKELVLVTMRLLKHTDDLSNKELVLVTQTMFHREKFKGYLEKQMEALKLTPDADKELVQKWDRMVNKILTADDDLVDSVIDTINITDEQLGNSELFIKINTIAEKLDEVFLNKIIEQTTADINKLPETPQRTYQINKGQESLNSLKDIREKLSLDEMNQALTQVSLQIPTPPSEVIGKIATVVGTLKNHYVKSCFKTHIQKVFDNAHNDADNYNQPHQQVEEYKNNINMFKKLAMEILNKGHTTELDELFEDLKQKPVNTKESVRRIMAYAVNSLERIKNSRHLS